MTPEERAEKAWAEATEKARNLHGRGVNHQDITYQMVRVLVFKCLELEDEIENLRSELLP